MENKETGFKINQKVLAYLIALVVIGGSFTGWITQFNQIGTNENNHLLLKEDVTSYKKWVDKELEKREVKAIAYIDNVIRMIKNDHKTTDQRLTKKIKELNLIREKIQEIEVNYESRISVLENEIKVLKK